VLTAPAEPQRERKRVVVLAVHPPSLAGTRLRAVQYAPSLRAAGLDLQLWTFLSDADVARWYGATHRGRLRALLRGFTRIPRAWRLVRRADSVWLLRDAIPIGAPWIERLLLRNKPWVWDVDDAVWQHTSATAGRLPTWLRATAHKYDVLCRQATQVWAGSEVLAEWCRERASDVRLVPSVVDVPEHLERRPRTRTACWIGSHSTTPFVAAIVPELLRRVDDLCVVTVGADPSLMPVHERLTTLPWTPTAEEEALAAADVGLYPVEPAHPLAEGKCGLKAILYLAHGVPPIVTPTRTNAQIVRCGIDGLHASDLDAWITSARRLLDDPELWDRCRTNGHRRVLADYSLQTWGPRVAAMFSAILSST
jgi:glycosyltransferase involved in cell wall biosynthesis